MKQPTKALLVLLLGIIPYLGYAEVPGTISFQGYLEDDSGNPINGTTEINFSIPSTVWNEYYPAVPVNNGVQGAQGPAGSIGAQGPKGAQGTQGPTGAQGPKGEKGDTGPQGVAGPMGPQGEKGEPGPQPDRLWTPISKINLGSLPDKFIGTSTYSIPSAVPVTAKEIFVYAYIRTGGHNPSRDIEFRIYTKEGSTEYSHYLFAHGYHQDAWSYNSNTFWLPTTVAWQINITSSGTAVSGNVDSQLYLVGYR